MNQDAVFLLFSRAKKQAQLSKYLGFCAVLVFVLFGSLASTATLKDNVWVYAAFVGLPYGFVGLSVPISVYHGFLLWRYRVMQTSILQMVFGFCASLSVVAIGLWLLVYPKEAQMAAFLALVAWFCLPYLFFANIQRFLSYLHQKNQNHPPPPQTKTQ